MRLFTPKVTTSRMPQVYEILNNILPNIFTSNCYNDDSLPFAREVLRTEIGHLFEHMVLEYLCHYKLEGGVRHAMYSGITRWNWTKEARGIFHITLSATAKDIGVLGKALDKSIALLHSILEQDIQSNPMPDLFPSQSSFTLQPQSSLMKNIL